MQDDGVPMQDDGVPMHDDGAPMHLRSSSILKYVEVVFLLKKKWCHLQFMTIRSSCIFKKIEVGLHSKKI
jgi:hypothetical protein